MKKYFFRLSAIGLMLSISSLLLADSDSLIFVIRVDDILCRNTSILPRSIKPFEAMAEERGAKVTWAVIPHRLIEASNSDGVLAQELCETVEKGHEISLHGYNHICPLCGSSGHEMCCPNSPGTISYTQQNTMIQDGLAILDSLVGVRPSSFVPPGNNADDTTFQVLLNNQIHIISTRGTRKDSIYNDLYNLGYHQEFTWALKPADYDSKLQNALNSVRYSIESDGFYCLLLHDYFIRAGYEDSLVIQWTGELLDNLLAHYGERLVFKTVTEVALTFQPGQIVGIRPYATPQATHLSLYQNYPNPFNPVTTICYRLPSEGPVQLDIFDLRGQWVAQLIRQTQSGGLHSIRWQPNGLSSGYYIYQLRTPNGVQRKTCLLMK